MIAALLFVSIIVLFSLMLLGWLLPAVIFVLVIAAIWKKLAKDKRMAKEDREESLKEGGVEEPRILRELNPSEKSELTKLSKNFLKYKHLLWILAPLFLIADIYLIYTLPPIVRESISSTVMNPISTDNFLLLFFGSVIIPLQLWFLQISLREYPSTLDLRSPVFGVQGRAVKTTDGNKGNQPMYYYLTVRGVRFTSQFNNDLVRETFDSFEEGNEVAVEYSPRTKHVWKIYKTEDI
jgi:hypothetical protein